MKKSQKKIIEKQLANVKVYGQTYTLLKKWGIDAVPSPEALEKARMQLKDSPEFQKQLGAILFSNGAPTYANAGTTGDGDDTDDSSKWWQVLFETAAGAYVASEMVKDSTSATTPTVPATTTTTTTDNTILYIAIGGVVLLVFMVLMLTQKK